MFHHSYIFRMNTLCKLYPIGRGNERYLRQKSFLSFTLKILLDLHWHFFWNLQYLEWKAYQNLRKFNLLFGRQETNQLEYSFRVDLWQNIRENLFWVRVRKKCCLFIRQEAVKSEVSCQMLLISSSKFTKQDTEAQVGGGCKGLTGGGGCLTADLYWCSTLLALPLHPKVTAAGNLSLILPSFTSILLPINFDL